MTEDVVRLVRALDEEDALLVLAHVADRLRGRLDEATVQSVHTGDDARELLAVFGAKLPAGLDAPPNDSPHEDVLALLEYAASDAASREVVRELATRVPVNRQLALDELVAAPLILGALVTLLQSRFNIRIISKEGKRSYEIEIGKDAADASVIGAVVGRVVKEP